MMDGVMGFCLKELCSNEVLASKAIWGECILITSRPAAKTQWLAAQNID